MILRLLESNDIDKIHGWPAYPDEFSELNYALCPDGWITQFNGKPATWIYVAEDQGEAIAFTILSTTAADAAEFRIALHAGWLGRGLGRTVAEATLARGFNELQLKYIHLIVRQNNLRARRLYEHLGFKYQGECEHEVRGKCVKYFVMGLLGKDFIIMESPAQCGDSPGLRSRRR